MAQQIGNWAIDRSIGEGGQSRAFMAHNVTDEVGTQYVLKLLKNRVDPARIARFKREADVGMYFNHPNVLRVVDHGVESDRPFVVTEYCDGGSLSDTPLAELSLVDKLKLFSDICRGVGYVHSKAFVHRDIKPDNIFLRSRLRDPVVGDFGLCMLIDDDERLTEPHEAIGARWFMAPELAHGFAEDVTHAADVYSLGKLLYWMLAGRVFDREVHRQPRFDLRGEQVASEFSLIYELLDKAIVEDPKGRFEDANQLQSAVDDIIRKVMAHAHSLDLNEPQHCIYCGVGVYKVAVDAPPERLSGMPQQDYDYKRTAQYDRMRSEFGLNPVTAGQGPNWLIFLCDNCGNVQLFRPDYSKDPPAWRR